MTDQKFIYVARKRCGCVVGLVTDDADKNTAKHVAEFISDGLTIDRVTWSDYKEKVSLEATFMNCSHRPVVADNLTLPGLEL